MIKQTLQKEQIEAMKAKDSFKLQTIRYILAQIKNKEIDSQKELEDQEVVDVLRKEAKKLHYEKRVTKQKPVVKNIKPKTKTIQKEDPKPSLNEIEQKESLNFLQRFLKWLNS